MDGTWSGLFCTQLQTKATPTVADKLLKPKTQDQSGSCQMDSHRPSALLLSLRCGSAIHTHHFLVFLRKASPAEGFDLLLPVGRFC